MTDVIQERLDGEILRITLNDPENGNALSNDAAKRLTELLKGAVDRSRMVVLDGAGDDFCTGRSMKGRKRTQPEALALRRTNDVIFECYAAFRKADVPIIAVVQGAAHGFGCALAAAADITIATDDATFRLPEFAHNKMPTMAMSALLGKLSAKSLMYVTYSSFTFDAARALQLGLVNEVVAKDSIDSTVAALCETMLKAPRPAVLAVKEFARSAPDMNIDHAIEYARALHSMVNSSSEMQRWEPKEKHDAE